MYVYSGIYCDFYLIFTYGMLVFIFCVYLCTLLSTGFVYDLIIHETRKCLQRMQQLSSLEQAGKMKELTDDTRAIKTFFLVVGIYAWSWGPLLILSLFMAQVRLDNDTKDMQPFLSSLPVCMLKHPL